MYNWGLIFFKLKAATKPRNQDDTLDSDQSIAPRPRPWQSSRSIRMPWGSAMLTTDALVGS